eukprot:UN34436
MTTSDNDNANTALMTLSQTINVILSKMEHAATHLRQLQQVRLTLKDGGNNENENIKENHKVEKIKIDAPKAHNLSTEELEKIVITPPVHVSEKEGHNNSDTSMTDSGTAMKHTE